MIPLMHTSIAHLQSKAMQQVAQLWQRDRTKLDTFSIGNFQRYSQNHQKIGFLGHPMEASGAIYELYLKNFYTKKSYSRVSSRECQLYS